MSLRTRLLVGLGMVLAVVVALGALVVVVQRNVLVAQLDTQLLAIAALPGAPKLPPGQAPGLPTERPDLIDDYISDIYIAALLGEGSVLTVVQGTLIEAAPDLSSIEVATITDESFLNAEAVRSLVTTFAIASSLVAITLGLIGWWVVRLGLRPIAARAIASGSRDERVESASQATEAGQLAAALNTMLDQRDEAEDRVRVFVSDASHELRTPLTSIQGYLDLYIQGAFRGEGELDDAVRRMRSEAIRDETISVDHLLSAVVRDAVAANPSRTIELASREGESLIIRGDPQRLHQLLVGLIANAVIHAPAATVKLSSRLVDDRVEIVVADDGPGMESEEASRAFDRFFRGDRSRSRLDGGSGLGLVIGQSIVEAHGGTIKVFTAPGDGSRFVMSYPR